MRVLSGTGERTLNYIYTHDLPSDPEKVSGTEMHCAVSRLVEEADFRAAQELFGGQDLDKMQPKSAKDFEDYAAALVHKYVAAHSRSPHYKTLVKALLKVGSMRLKPHVAQRLNTCCRAQDCSCSCAREWLPVPTRPLSEPGGGPLAYLSGELCECQKPLEV